MLHQHKEEKLKELKNIILYKTIQDVNTLNNVYTDNNWNEHVSEELPIQAVDYGRNKRKSVHENTNIERSRDSDFNLAKEASVRQHYETNTFINDYILRVELNQLFVAEDTSHSSQMDSQLKITAPGLMETCSTTTCLQISNCDLSRTNFLKLSPESQIINILRKDMNIITKFDNP